MAKGTLEKIGIGKCNPDIFENKGYAQGWNNAVGLIEQLLNELDIANDRRQAVMSFAEAVAYNVDAGFLCFSDDILDFAGEYCEIHFSGEGQTNEENS